MKRDRDLEEFFEAAGIQPTEEEKLVQGLRDIADDCGKKADAYKRSHPRSDHAREEYETLAETLRNLPRARPLRSDNWSNVKDVAEIKRLRGQLWLRFVWGLTVGAILSPIVARLLGYL